MMLPPSYRRSAPGAPERDAAREERSLAALGYVFWPLAISSLLTAGDAPRSAWLRRHAKQAIVFGCSAWAIVFCIFAFPLVLLSAGIVPFSATVTLYGFAFFVDCASLLYGFVLSLAAARRAMRGEEFALRSLLPIAKKDLP